MSKDSIVAKKMLLKAEQKYEAIPAAEKIERDGISIGDNQAILLKKIEELTLYVIDQQKQITNLYSEIKRIKKDK